jgi:hypothetical protein
VWALLQEHWKVTFKPVKKLLAWHQLVPAPLLLDQAQYLLHLAAQCQLVA